MLSIKGFVLVLLIFAAGSLILEYLTTLKMYSSFKPISFSSVLFLTGKNVKSLISAVSIDEHLLVTKNNNLLNLTRKANDSSCTITPQKGVIFPENPAYFTECIKQQVLPVKHKKLVVFLNHPAWFRPTDGFYRCQNACTLSYDRSQLQKADAVVVHVARLGISHPPQHRPSQQLYIAYGMEAPNRYAGHYKSSAWRDVFNWTMTHRTDADVFATYGWLSVRSKPLLKNFTEITLQKTKPIAWFVSNCNSKSSREKYVKILRKYINVDVYGGCGQLTCSKTSENECLGLLNSTYYFYLSFENALCKDYVTEKLFKLYNNVNIIPIVRGGADYGRYFPPGTFLNTADFKSPKDLAMYLTKLMKDTKVYAQMLATKDRFYSETSLPHKNFCLLCAKLHSAEIKAQHYSNYMEWIDKGMCKSADDV